MFWERETSLKTDLGKQAPGKKELGSFCSTSNLKHVERRIAYPTTYAFIHILSGDLPF